jgi:hypothetical protein
LFSTRSTVAVLTPAASAIWLMVTAMKLVRFPHQLNQS